MKRIEITREGDTVKFENVTVVNTDTVFFVNLDPLEAHWPDISADQVGPFPSLPSSECQLPEGSYRCRIEGHDEEGSINQVEPLTAVNTKLPDAINGQQIAHQKVVTGGKSPYQISGQLFEINDSTTGALILSGSGIGPGLQLIPTIDDRGISVEGTPTLSGTYHFTFTVDDKIEGNLQQAQYSMKVV
jgi:hypothetical protein